MSLFSLFGEEEGDDKKIRYFPKMGSSSHVYVAPRENGLRIPAGEQRPPESSAPHLRFGWDLRLLAADISVRVNTTSRCPSMREDAALLCTKVEEYTRFIDRKLKVKPSHPQGPKEEPAPRASPHPQPKREGSGSR